MRQSSMLLAAIVSLPILVQPAIAQERPNTILVLDASGSMWGQIDGVNKIVIAREVVSDLLADFPPEQNLGLVTYGHQRRGDCSDIQTLVAPAPGSAAEIVRIVNGLNPRGMTPMTDAVIAAADALRFTENAATVILVSDGIETCNPDPCAAARVLAETGVDFTAHVVGFDVAGEAQALAQMQCIAEETGGLFLTADNADELAGALQTVVATIAEPEPAPEPEPEVATVTLRATMDSEDGPEVTDPVAWSIAAPAFSQEADGNPVTLELESGAYEITGHHVVLEQSASVQASVVGGMERTVTVIFQTPTPAASLVAPDSAEAGSLVEIAWTGPDLDNDNVQVAHLGGSYINYAYTHGGNPAEVRMPAQPGIYELRYVLNDRETIATRPIEVTPVALALIAPESAAAGSRIEVGWQGPDAPDDNIQIAHVGGSYIHYAYTSSGNPAVLQMPAEPGSYELRYSFRDGETIFTRPIEVTAVKLGLTAPDRASAGARVEVGWAGPDAPGDNVQVAHVGGSYIDYAYTRDGNPLALVMPAQPGAYELRYVFQDRETIATRPIEVTAIKLALIAPESAAAGSRIEVGWQGPDAPGDNVQVAHVGGGYINYAYTQSGNPAVLEMPAEPGSYELRYQFRDRETIFTRPIEVRPAP